VAITTLGIDFDNTLANYTGVFHRVGVDLGWLPSSVDKTKSAVKDYFILRGQEEQWTALQGIVYGKEITQAALFDGVLDILDHLLGQGINVVIISHKTQYPVIGDRVSLHNSAMQWLEDQGIVGCAGRLSRDDVFFCETQAIKIQHIAKLGCDAFIDDLPAIFQRADFPAGIERILFDPAGQHSAHSFAHNVITCWRQLPEVLSDQRPV
jgi:hypothetical protein